MKDQVVTHESYGVVALHRRSSTGSVLFASSIKHRNTIGLTISRAEIHKDTHTGRNWHSPTDELIRIVMSPSQFAELITTPDMASGVPCTIEHINRKGIAEPPFEHTARRHRDAFIGRAQKITDGSTLYMKEALDVLENKSSISKTDRKLILDAVKMMRQEIEKNLPYLQTLFDEQMEATITEAKSEIEAFVEHKVRSVGLEAIREQVPQLTT